MLKPYIEIADASICPLIIRTINEKDIDYLRELKNTHREMFFYTDIITPEQQIKWYKAFKERRDDFMFVITTNTNEYIGCIGTRLIDDNCDVYNVMAGNQQYSGKGIMSLSIQALAAINNLLYPNYPVRVKVLTKNPAISWYQKNGFNIINTYDNYVLMELTKSKSVDRKFNCKIEIEIPFI